MTVGTTECSPENTRVTQQAKGDVFSTEVHFDEKWCMDFLALSGDKNMSLHSASGKRIVQGMALLTKIGTFVSEVLPGYAAYELGSKIKFQRPIYINETVSMTLRITVVGYVRSVAELTVTMSGDVLLKLPITLASEKLLDRIK